MAKATQFWVGALLALLFNTACQRMPVENAKPAAKPVALVFDDAAVINAALLSFFQPAEGALESLGTWDTGDYVVVSPAWDSPERPDFEGEIRGSLVWYDAYTDGKPKAEALRKILTSIKKPSQPLRFDAVQPVDKLKLDDRIVLRNVKLELFQMLSDVKVKNAAGKVGTVCAMGRLGAVGYSADGQYACVELSHVPYSRHDAILRFFLVRVYEAWAVVHVWVIYRM